MIKFERYKVSDKDKARLMKELKGDKRKVKAIVMLAEYEGRLTLEEIAGYVGVARMTLWRWQQGDYVYQYELDRQYKRQQEHFQRQLRRNKGRFTTAQILGDPKMLEMIVDSLRA